MENTEKMHFGTTSLKGTLVSLAAAIVGVLILAFFLRIWGFSDTLLNIFVQIIKGASIFFGVWWALKKQKEMGLLVGLAIGALFSITAFLLFSILNGFTFLFDASLITNIIFGTITGGISGIIAVNLKK